MSLIKKNTISLLAFYFFVFSFSDSGAVVTDSSESGDIARSFQRLRSIRRMKAGNADTESMKTLRSMGVSQKAAREALDKYAAADSGVDESSDEEDPFISTLQTHFKSKNYWENREKKAENEALEYGVFGLAYLNESKDLHHEFLEQKEAASELEAGVLDVETAFFPTLQAISTKEELEESRSLFQEQLDKKNALVKKYRSGMDLENFLVEAYDLEGRGLVEKIKATRNDLVAKFNASEIDAESLLKALIVLEGEKMATARMEILLQKPRLASDLQAVERQSVALAQKYGRLQYAMGGLYDRLYSALSEEGYKAISGGEKVYDAFLASKKFQAATSWFQTKYFTEKGLKERKRIIGALKRTKRIFLENLEILRQSQDEEARARATKELRALEVDPALIEELADVQRTPDLKKRVKKIFRHLKERNNNLSVVRGIFKEHSRDKDSLAIRKAAKARMFHYFKDLQKAIEDYQADRQHFLNSQKETRA